MFADTADHDGMLGMFAEPYIKGFTTNQTLMRQTGVTNYEAFAKEILTSFPDRPIRFEVFSDEYSGTEHPAMKNAALGDNVYVEIPITTTERGPSDDLVTRLSKSGVKVTVTAIKPLRQKGDVVASLSSDAPGSVEALRAASPLLDAMPYRSWLPQSSSSSSIPAPGSFARPRGSFSMSSRQTVSSVTSLPLRTISSRSSTGSSTDFRTAP